MTTFRLPERALLALAIMAVAGCYTYRPLAAAEWPVAGNRVRVSLTMGGTTELARFLGPRVILAEGELISVEGDSSLVIGVDFVQTMDGIKQPWTGEGQVSFPSTYVSEVRERAFLKRQSIAMATGVSAGLVVIAIKALRSGGASGDPGNGAGGTPP